MDFLYNYGICQEDVLTERSALDLSDGDNLLCIASAGEVPLGLATLKNVNITAVDTSPAQLMLCRIKQAAALHLESLAAAAFLGYMEMRPGERLKLFKGIVFPCLKEPDRKYWINNLGGIEDGVINRGRFEMFMRKVAGAGRMLVGEKNLYGLFECSSVEQQQELFEKKINGPLVKGIFRIAFHPWIYRKRGIDPAGLTHSGARNIGEFFFTRFRNFCCSTPARRNFYLQYTFFNRILYPEALPEFLKPQLKSALSANSANTKFMETSVEALLRNADCGQFNKIHISNLGDWMSGESMANLFRLIRDKTEPGARIAMRYIHLSHKIPEDAAELRADIHRGFMLESSDRYPFYSIVPIVRN
jgi:S-adenosylmethionine:diacylglycerol 3-amino-3-carboxypropyl transferase